MAKQKRIRYQTNYLIETTLDTNQRLHSDELDRRPRRARLAELCACTMVEAVAVLAVKTGEVLRDETSLVVLARCKPAQEG